MGWDQSLVDGNAMGCKLLCVMGWDGKFLVLRWDEKLLVLGYAPLPSWAFSQDSL